MLSCDSSCYIDDQIQGRKLLHVCFRINLGRLGPISVLASVHGKVNCKIAYSRSIAHLYLMYIWFGLDLNQNI